jgi:hypothetical protein
LFPAAMEHVGESRLCAVPICNNSADMRIETWLRSIYELFVDQSCANLKPILGDTPHGNVHLVKIELNDRRGAPGKYERVRRRTNPAFLSAVRFWRLGGEWEGIMVAGNRTPLLSGRARNKQTRPSSGTDFQKSVQTCGRCGPCSLSRGSLHGMCRSIMSINPVRLSSRSTFRV